IEYLERPWATVDVDLAPVTADCETDPIPPIALADFGLTSSRSVPCLALHAQIAQKIHALTEPEPRGRPNPRARDVLDVLLVIQQLDMDHTLVRSACERTFAERAKHKWPMYSFTFPQAWHTKLPEIARTCGYETDDVSIIETRFNSYLARLTGSE